MLIIFEHGKLFNLTIGLINLIISFGKSFLFNILNEQYLEKRLHQEDILKCKFKL